MEIISEKKLKYMENYLGYLLTNSINRTTVESEEWGREGRGVENNSQLYCAKLGYRGLGVSGTE